MLRHTGHSGLVVAALSIALAGCSADSREVTESSAETGPTAAGCHPELRDGDRCTSTRFPVATCPCTLGNFVVCCSKSGEIYRYPAGCVDFGGPGFACEPAIDAGALDADSDSASDG